MAQYEHLRLARLPERMERRRRPGFGSTPPRDPSVHGSRLAREVEAVLADHRRARPAVIDPSLILRVRLDTNISEEQWASIGLTLLSSDLDRSLILFSNENELRAFRDRLDAYVRPSSGGGNPPYAAFVGAIAAVESVTARDRIGRRFKDEGFAGPDDFDPSETYVVDVEIWDLGDRTLREARVNQIDRYVTESGGSVLDRYIGPSVGLTRVTVGGDALQIGRAHV